MNDTPPRRSRRSSPPSQRSSLPLVPILIGVVVLGFIIGAGLSLAGRRGGGDRTVIANVAATPVPTLAPVTPAPAPVAATEAASKADVVSPPPSEAAAASVATPHAAATQARATGVPTHAPAIAAVASAAPATAAAPTAGPATSMPVKATASPRTVARPVATAKRVRVAAAGATDVAARAPVSPAAAAGEAAPVASDDADSDFARLASAVVRQYVAAIERGDTSTAYAAFGPGAAGNVRLLESGTLDASTRIQHLEARSAGDNATVNVDLKTAKGRYFGQYTVHRTESGAALITDHALNSL